MSPETVTYLVLLAVVVLQDRVLGCLHFIIIVLLFTISCWGLRTDRIVLPSGQLPDCAKRLELPAFAVRWLRGRFEPEKPL